jgi:alpha-glucosidase
MTKFVVLTCNFPFQDESYEFIYKLRKMMDEYSKTAEKNHTRLMMTEAYASVPQQVRWYGKDEENQGGHWPFNFALIINLDKNSKAADFQAAINEWVAAMPSYGVANWVLGNHDRPRLGYRYGEDRHESLAILSMALPGNNVIYYVSTVWCAKCVKCFQSINHFRARKS